MRPDSPPPDAQMGRGMQNCQRNQTGGADYLEQPREAAGPIPRYSTGRDVKGQSLTVFSYAKNEMPAS